MAKNSIKLYDGKAYGVRVSGYGLEHGYLDYQTLAQIVGDCILNNEVFNAGYPEDWALVNGEDQDEEYHEYYDIYQFYIISDRGYEILSELTDEIVYYNNELDMYLWGITHFGTAWSYVLTDVKIED